MAAGCDVGTFTPAPFDIAKGDSMTTQDSSLIKRQQAAPVITKLHQKKLNFTFSTIRTKGALTTSAVLVVLWAGFHWNEPASWSVGVPMSLIGGALTLCVTASAHRRISPLGWLRFAKLVSVGILCGAVDVSRRSLSPKTLKPRCISWRSYLPEGRPRRLFAIAITLLPGTLSARIEGKILTVHALDPSVATHTELSELEAQIAELYRFDHKEVLP